MNDLLHALAKLDKELLLFVPLWMHHTDTLITQVTRKGMIS